MLLQFIIFGVVGLALEVLWTGLGSLKSRDFRATSKTSIWMFFIYGLAAFMWPLVALLAPFPWFVRGLVYAAGIFLVEYAAGMALKLANACPWDYSHARTNISGVIRLDYAPLWVIVGLLMEYIHLNFFN